MYSRLSGALTHASLSATGLQGTATLTTTAISGDGRFVAWEEWGNGRSLVDGDTNEEFDVIVRDRDADQDGLFDEPGAIRTIRASQSDAGVIGNSQSFRPV